MTKQKATEMNSDTPETVSEETAVAVVEEAIVPAAEEPAKKEKKSKKKEKDEVPPEIGEAIEAILFAAGHAMPYAVLARVLALPLSKTKQIVYSYAIRYNNSEIPRGVMMLTFDDSCQLCTKQQYLPFIRDALGIRHNGNLSNASVETLAIIAYNQPVTRSYVDTVRGVDSSYAIGSLLERGLIESKGRLDAPGRPMLYGTTPDFLRCFGLSSIAELPGVSSEEAAEMLAKINRQMEMEMQIDENQVTIDPEAVTPHSEDTADGDEDGPTPDPTAVAIGETVETDEES